MKQIALAATQYAQDYDEMTIPYITGNQRWGDLTQPYLKSTQILVCPSDSFAKLRYAVGQTPPTLCMRTSDAGCGLATDQYSYGINNWNSDTGGFTVQRALEQFSFPFGAENLATSTG